jgi:putative membrane protein
MPGILTRMLITAAGLWLAAELIDGIQFETTGSLLAAAVLLGVVNAVVRPLLVLLTLPITILTLGLFLLVVNGAMLSLVAWMLSGFSVDGTGAALLGAIVVGFTSWVASWYIGPTGRPEVLVVERRLPRP